MGFWWTTCSDYVSFVLPFTVLYNYLLKAGHDMLSNRNWDKERMKAKLHVNLTNDQSLFNASVAVGARGFTFFSVPGHVFCFDFGHPWVSLLRENLSCSCFSCSLQKQVWCWSHVTVVIRHEKEHPDNKHFILSLLVGLLLWTVTIRSVPSVRPLLPI